MVSRSSNGRASSDHGQKPTASRSSARSLTSNDVEQFQCSSEWRAIAPRYRRRRRRRGTMIQIKMGARQPPKEFVK